MTLVSTVSRVVPGMFVTMARSYPARALSREELARVGAADQNAGDALIEQRPPAAGGQERLQRRFLPGEDLSHLFGLEGVDVLVGIV